MKVLGGVGLCAALLSLGCMHENLQKTSTPGPGYGNTMMNARYGNHGAAWNASQEIDEPKVEPDYAFKGGRGTQWESQAGTDVGVRPVTTAGKGTEWNDAKGLDMMSGLEQSSSLNAFTGALKRTGMDKELEEVESFTVLAPNDFAFQQMSTEMQADLFGPEGNAQLRDLVKRHIVVGKYDSVALANAGELTTMAGTHVDVKNVAGLPQPGGAQVLSSTETKSGYVHQIDRVLTP